MATTPCILQVTPSYAATQGNEFNFSGLYLYHTYKGPNANQVETIVRHQFGTLAVNNWVIRDGLSCSAEVIARAQGLHVNAGDWHNSFSLVFEDEGYVCSICWSITYTSIYSLRPSLQGVV